MNKEKAKALSSPVVPEPRPQQPEEITLYSSGAGLHSYLRLIQKSAVLRTFDRLRVEIRQ